MVLGKTYKEMSPEERDAAARQLTRSAGVRMRVAMAMLKLDAPTIAALAEHRDCDVAMMHGVGPYIYAELVAKLADHGLAFKAGNPPKPSQELLRVMAGCDR